MTTTVLRTSIAYDPAGHPSRFTPPNGWAPPAGTRADWLATSAHDALGRVIGQQAPDSGSGQAVYDDAGRLRFAWDDDGAPGAATNPAPAAAHGAPQVAIRYARYDRLGRLTEQGWCAAPAWDRGDLQARANGDWPRGCPTWRERRFYAAAGAAAGTNAEGRLVRIDTRQADGSLVTETAAYDVNGRLVGRTTALPGLAPETVGLTYDRAGRVRGTVLPPLAAGQASLTLERRYDCWGLCQGVAGPDGELAAYRWHPDRRPAGLCLGGGLIEQQFGYASRGDPRTLGGNLLTQTLYYGDPPLTPAGTPIAPARRNGLLCARAETWLADAGTTVTTGYRWDLAGQLLATSAADGAAQETFAYDPNGNLLTHDSGECTRTFGYQGATNRLGRADARPGDWVYSPAGRLVQGPEWAFDYDFSTGLVSALVSTDGTTRLDFTYGAASQRLVKTARTPTGQVTRRYLPGAAATPALETWQADGGTPQRIAHLDGPLGPFGYAMLAADGSPRVIYLLRDHQHSVRALVGPDGLLSRHGYHPFGLAANDSGADDSGGAIPTCRFTGAEWDPESGLYNLRRRLYDPDLQRFLAPDPAGQYHSPYLYVANNPLQSADPTGGWAIRNTLGEFAAGFEIALGGICLIATDGATIRFSGTLIGAGIAGAAYSGATGSKDWSAGTFWGGFGAAQAVGAAVGGGGGEAWIRWARRGVQGAGDLVQGSGGLGEGLASRAEFPALSEVGDFPDKMPRDADGSARRPSFPEQDDLGSPEKPGGLQQPDPPPPEQRPARPTRSAYAQLWDANDRKGQRWLAGEGKTLGTPDPRAPDKVRITAMTSQLEQQLLSESFSNMREQIPFLFKPKV